MRQTFRYISVVAYVLLFLSWCSIKEAGAQVLNQETQRLLQNTCRGLALSGGQSAFDLENVGFGPNLATICSANQGLTVLATSGGGAASLQGSTVSIINRNLLRRLEEIRDEDSENSSPRSASGRSRPTLFRGPFARSLGTSTELTQSSVGVGSVSPLGFSSSRWNGLGFFATGQGEILNRNIGIFQDGFSSNIFGFTAGADYRASKTFVGGGAFTYANTNGEFRQGGTFSTNAYTLTLYASYLPTERTFLQATAGITQNKYLIARPSRLDGLSGGTNTGIPRNFDGISSSNSNGNVYSWTVLGGYDYPIERFTVGPRVGLNFARTFINGYTEQGGRGLDLKYDDQLVESFQSVLGVQGSAPFSWKHGVLVTQFNADYIHEFANSQRRINVQFAEDGRSPGLGSTNLSDSNFSTQNPTRFAFQNDVPARNWFSLGTGLISVLPNGYQPFINFRAMVGNSQFTNYVWTLGLRVEL